MTTVFVKIMCSHSIKSVLIYSLVIYEYFLKERINLLGKKSISDIVSDETVEVLGVAAAMFEKQVGRGRGFNRKSHLIQSSRKKTRQFFCNLMRKQRQKHKWKQRQENMRRTLSPQEVQTLQDFHLLLGGHV